MKRVVAAFYFDCTLTERDTFLPFLRHCCGAGRVGKALTRCFLPWIRYSLGLAERQEVKESMLTHTLFGQEEAMLEAWSRSFVAEEIPKYLKKEGMERLKWHQDQGHETVLVSASFRSYLQPWAEQMGMKAVLSSEIEVIDGRVTGKLAGRNCRGPEKVNRLEAWLGDRRDCTLYAYGDSDGDTAMLAYADHPYLRKFH